MTTTRVPSATADLPPAVARSLERFVESATEALGDTLRSIILFGSAAEGQLRSTSDVNVLLLLTRFDRERVDRIREPFRFAEAAIRLQVMILLENELSAASSAFAAKLADIERRHRILAGTNPFDGVSIPRGALIARLKQVLLNLTVRARSVYLERSLRDEQMARAVAEEAGPLRSCAAALLELDGESAPSPKEALARMATALAPGRFDGALARLSEARETGSLPPGTGGDTLFELLELADRMRAKAEGLPESRA